MSLILLLQVREVIQVLNDRNVEYIVAPYEADAQLAYLFKTKSVDAVITEDGDLAACECACACARLCAVTQRTVTCRRLHTDHDQDGPARPR